MFQEVQSLYELCTFSADLKKFCKDLGVNYDAYCKWQRRQQWSEEQEKTVEVDTPPTPVMTGVTIVGMPEEREPSEDDDAVHESNGAADVSVCKSEETEEEPILGKCPEMNAVMGFNLHATTLAEVICAGRGLNARVESFKVHMHDGLHLRLTHIPLREAIRVLHQLNVMYSC